MPATASRRTWASTCQPAAAKACAAARPKRPFAPRTRTVGTEAWVMGFLQSDGGLPMTGSVGRRGCAGYAKSCMRLIQFRMNQGSLAHFDWRLVRSFLAVLDAGSISAAAQRSGAQQPTLSRHVAELETQLGAPLFERTGRGVTPTGAALAIADAARRMEDGALALARRRQ